MVKHTKSPVSVYETSDYNRFRLIKGNRDLDVNKLKRIIADIERGTNLLRYCPVLVVEKGDKLDIVDGQHRFAVSKKIKSPVYYILAEELTLYDIARMNSNTEKWKAKDFINCYCELGNKDYISLREFMKAYAEVPFTSAIQLMAYGRPHNGGGNILAPFHQGTLKVPCEKEAYAFMEVISQFDFEYKFSRHFMLAIYKVLKAEVFPVEDLIDRVNRNREDLSLQSDYKKYLTNLELIANTGAAKRCGGALRWHPHSSQSDPLFA